MADNWMCQREGCGHNKSMHAYEWNRFRGVWDTFCKAESYGTSGRDRCRCGSFLSEDDVKVAV